MERPGLVSATPPRPRRRGRKRLEAVSNWATRLGNENCLFAGINGSFGSSKGNAPGRNRTCAPGLGIRISRIRISIDRVLSSIGLVVDQKLIASSLRLLCGRVRRDEIDDIQAFVGSLPDIEEPEGFFKRVLDDLEEAFFHMPALKGGELDTRRWAVSYASSALEADEAILAELENGANVDGALDIRSSLLELCAEMPNAFDFSASARALFTGAEHSIVEPFFVARPNGEIGRFQLAAAAAREIERWQEEDSVLVFDANGNVLAPRRIAPDAPLSLEPTGETRAADLERLLKNALGRTNKREGETPLPALVPQTSRLRRLRRTPRTFRVSPGLIKDLAERRDG